MKIIPTIETIYQSPSGVTSFFVRHGCTGFKVYRDPDTRDGCYRLQRYYHSLGLAPWCDFCMTFDGPDGQEYYAYCTEVAEVYKDGDNEAWWYNEARMLSADIYDCTGYNWFDSHKGNVGFIAGRRVCIDCDPDYTYDENGDILSYHDIPEV